MHQLKLFSLIIPCHNPEKTIFRLFDSLTRQSISNADLEVIVVDDNSDSVEYKERLKSYGFDLIFADTDTNIHCPGNTRRKGMEYVTGQWVFFADQDDYFEDGVLGQLKEYIKCNSHRTMYIISTIMRAYDPDVDKCYHEFRYKQAWLHGKWYSMENLIKPFNINFKQDLKTHEDVYFNSLALSALYKTKGDMDCIEMYTYRWVDNPESLTRRPTHDRGYLFENFEDYLIAASEPYWEDAVNTKELMYVNQIIMTMLHAYFYYESASYYNGPNQLVDIAEIISNYVKRAEYELKYSSEDIINYVYDDPYKYSAVRVECKLITGEFIEKTSFRDFIFKVAKM